MRLCDVWQCLVLSLLCTAQTPVSARRGFDVGRPTTTTPAAAGSRRRRGLIHDDRSPLHEQLTRLVSRTTVAAITGAGNKVAASQQPWRSQQQQRSQRRGQPYKPPTDIRFMSPAEYDRLKSRHSNSVNIYQANLRRRRPNQYSITSRIVGLTVAAFCLQCYKPIVTDWGLKLSDRILRGEQLYRLVTPVLLHGGIIHLFTNMVSLQRVGNDVEKLFGPGRYMSTYVAAGIGGNLMSALQSPNPSLGASGAVFGIVGAYFVFLNRNEWLLGEYGEAMTTNIGQTMLMNVVLGFMMPQIDNWAHLGGALTGGAMAYAFGPRLYLTDLPNEMGRAVVDRPVLRTPAGLEALPRGVQSLWDATAGRLERTVQKMLQPKATTPWQHSRRMNYERRNAPPRSIKPEEVD